MVSVIIPMYNAERTIRTTVNSVLEQTYRDLEIIIVNDGSADGSLDIVKDMQSTNKSDIPIFLINKVNGGVSTARNVGMRAAKGKWIALLDSDDKWLPTKLSQQMEILEADPKIDFIGTNRNGEYFNRFFFRKFDEISVISSRLLLYKTFFVTPTVVFKKSILETVGYFDETQRYAEEGNFWIRVCKDHRCVLLNRSLAVTGDNKPNFGFSGLSSNLKEMEKGELKNMKDALRLRIVMYPEYIFLIGYSLIKYIRRILIVKFRRNAA